MKKIGVFFGSRSPEHDISIITAQLIISGLKGLGHEVIPVYLAKNGQWLVGEGLDKIENFSKTDFLSSHEANLSKAEIDLKESVGKIVLVKKGVFSKKWVIDLAFPALHGSYGEDGKIQGLFEMFDVPYVGCDVLSSAISMDKSMVKLLCKQNGMSVTDFMTATRDEWLESKKEVLSNVKKQLKFPVFVKPVHLGSSIGISKVKSANDLEEKIDVGFYYDNKVIVEESVEDLMDVTCSVIGNNDPIPSLLQESNFSADLFDFETKYLEGGQLGKSEIGIVIPANLDEKTTKEIQAASVEIYKIVGCNGIARVDFLYDKKSKKFFINEINPLPGTLYHHLWKKSGIELNDLLQKLIDYAQETSAAKKQLNYVFNSSVLAKTKTNKLKFGDPSDQ
jgi:D-alanine-D-alanine ligase